MGIHSAVDKLKKLSDLKPLSATELNLWVEKHFNLFKKSKLIYNQKELDKILEEFCYNPSNEYKFIILYNALLKLSEIHKRERYCKNELQSLWLIQNDKESVNLWVQKNRLIWEKELASFIVNYMDYSKSPIHLHLFIDGYPELNILVDSDDFKNILQFLKISDLVYLNTYNYLGALNLLDFYLDNMLELSN